MIKKVLLLIISGLILFLAINQVVKNRLTRIPPSTHSEIEEFIASPSAYVNDETVLKIEKDLEELEQDLNALDLDELQFRPPVLDLNVKMKL